MLVEPHYTLGKIPKGTQSFEWESLIISNDTYEQYNPLRMVFLTKFRNQSVLVMNAGAGILALKAAEHGASHVVAIESDLQLRQFCGIIVRRHRFPITVKSRIYGDEQFDWFIGPAQDQHLSSKARVGALLRRDPLWPLNEVRQCFSQITPLGEFFLCQR